MADKQTVKLLVEGGKANAGPPLGPNLAPLKLNIGQIVADINAKTKEFSGISVPVEVIVDTGTKKYEIKVGTPSVSQLIKKEMKLQSLAKTPWSIPKPKEPAAAAEGAAEAAPKEVEKVEEFKASIEFDKILKIAEIKADSLGSTDRKKQVKEVLGTCLSCGVRVDGKNPKEVIKEVDSGVFDGKFA